MLKLALLIYHSNRTLFRSQTLAIFKHLPL